ncbi:MAG: heavy-metal-associated domain-containing protein [Rhizobiales bacterium]|nr:heavy-metal-associated domain-containing protein [Hyphomicrobiales bacterium]
MVCDGCAEKVRMALTGVHGVKPSAWRKRVAVRYIPAEVGVSQLEAALADAGFEAEEA